MLLNGNRFTVVAYDKNGRMARRWKRLRSITWGTAKDAPQADRDIRGKSTPTGCHKSYILLIVFHAAFTQQSYQFIARRHLAMVLFLIHYILDDTFFI